MRPSVMNRKRNLLYFYILLLIGCAFLVHLLPKTGNPTNNKSPDLSRSKQNAIPSSKTTEFNLICLPKNSTQTCPINDYPTIIQNSSSSIESCPDYFKWIHEDLKPWKSKGITKEMVEAGKKEANFRLIILDGRVYFERYKKAYQTRDVFTLWGILQLLRLYPGKLPDLELMFGCGDKAVIKKSDYKAGNPVPVFHYAGDDEHFDIPFPDWSFWGWRDSNIKPWELELEEIKKGNKKMKWVNRKPFAHWKGNSKTGNRTTLLKCNSTRSWKSEIYHQDGFEQSDIENQCTYKYKIQMEGKAGSTSEKYILGCDSMLLLVKPQYYQFFTRSLLPLTHYWPINPSKLCDSIKFAVNWGNKNPDQAQEIGKAGSKFIMEELKMRYIYDYMYHLLNEYGNLMKYKPNVPSEATEICSETMACNAVGKEKKWKFDTLVKAPSQTSPCLMPPAYGPQHLQKFQTIKEEISRDVEGLAGVGL